MYIKKIKHFTDLFSFHSPLPRTSFYHVSAHSEQAVIAHACHGYTLQLSTWLSV